MTNTNLESRADVLKTGEINPAFDAFLKQIGPLPSISGDLEAARAVMAGGELSPEQFYPDEADVEYQITVPARDAYEIPVFVFKPEEAKKPGTGSPLVIMFHSGGWTVGSALGARTDCRLFSRKYGATCLSVEYRKAPEHVFPTAVNDAWDVVKWAAANATTLGANPKAGFVLGGCSAGSNLADTAAHRARDEKLSPPITGLIEMVPPCLDASAVPDEYKSQYQSIEQNRDAPVLGVKEMSFLLSQYKPELASPLFSSFLWPTGHARLPPVVFMVCGMDPLRDEAILYNKALCDNGVKTRFHLYPGYPHQFWTLFPMLPDAEKAMDDIVQGMGWLLGVPEQKAK